MSTDVQQWLPNPCCSVTPASHQAFSSGSYTSGREPKDSMKKLSVHVLSMGGLLPDGCSLVSLWWLSWFGNYLLYVQECYSRNHTCACVSMCTTTICILAFWWRSTVQHMSLLTTLSLSCTLIGLNDECCTTHKLCILRNMALLNRCGAIQYPSPEQFHSSCFQFVMVPLEIMCGECQLSL